MRTFVSVTIINLYLLHLGAMHFGMFGMWGTYVFAVIILYSPTGSDVPGANGKIWFYVAYNISSVFLLSKEECSIPVLNEQNNIYINK